MRVSEEEKRLLASQARALASIETDEEPRADRRGRLIDQANAARAEAGRAPLHEDDDLPEEGFYRRARALGFRRVSG